MRVLTELYLVIMNQTLFLSKKKIHSRGWQKEGKDLWSPSLVSAAVP